MTYTILNIDGSYEEYQPIDGKKPSLAEMQAIVGGCIERVTVTGGELWVNEDGIGLNLEVNPIGTKMVGGLIVGRALLCIRARRVRRAKPEPA